METEAAHTRRASARDAPRQFAHLLFKHVLWTLRWVAFGLLALLRPLLIPVLSWLAVGGILLWVIFVPIAHDAQFPTLRVLGMSLGCALAAIAYYALMEALAPGYLGRGR